MGDDDKCEGTCCTSELKLACLGSLEEGAPWLDLSPFLGLKSGEGPSVAVSNLINIMAAHDAPEISVGWNDKYLTVSKTDGGVMVTFEVRF